jgi:flavorubredoxin
MPDLVEVAPRIFALTELVPIDARISWIAPGTTGFEPYNIYLVESDEALLLLDTGVALHRRQVLDAVRQRLGGRRLVVFNTRSELECIGNLGAVLDGFDHVQVVTSCPLNPFDLVHRRQPQRVHGPTNFLAFGDTLEEFGFPSLKTLRPPIKMLGTSWVHDADRQVLFSSDSFGGDLLASAAEPRIRDHLDDAPTQAQLRAAMMAKFDWLQAADRPMLRQLWDALFDRHDVAVIAPNHGRIQRGRMVAARALADYREALVA